MSKVKIIMEFLFLGAIKISDDIYLYLLFIESNLVETIYRFLITELIRI